MELLTAACMGRKFWKKMRLWLVSSIQLSCSPWFYRREAVPKTLRIEFVAEDSLVFRKVNRGLRVDVILYFPTWGEMMAPSWFIPGTLSSLCFFFAVVHFT